MGRRCALPLQGARRRRRGPAAARQGRGEAGRRRDRALRQGRRPVRRDREEGPDLGPRGCPDAAAGEEAGKAAGEEVPVAYAPRMMRVLILARTHRVLCDGDRSPELSVDDLRPLRRVHAAFAARGLALPAPAGSRAGQDGGRDVAFVIAPVPAPAGYAWRSLRDASNDGALWQLYAELMLGGWPPPTRAGDVWSFGNQPEMAAQLVHLVACGAKR